MSHLIHCDLLLYGRKFSHSVSRLPGDVMGKPQSLDRRQDKRCRTSATSSRDRVRIPSPSESPSSQLKVVGKRSRQRRARSPHLPSTTPRIRHAVAHVQNILFAFCRFARTSDHSSSAISHVYAFPPHQNATVSFKELCGLTPAANMKQCILTVSTWLMNSERSLKVMVDLSESYPTMEAQGPVPELLRKVLNAYDMVSTLLNWDAERNCAYCGLSVVCRHVDAGEEIAF